MVVEHFKYLDKLRDSGAVNMFASGLYLSKNFSLSDVEAGRIVGLWMTTFDESKSVEQRFHEATKKEE